MISNSFFSHVIPVGISQDSVIINVPINSFYILSPITKNVLIKKIDFNLVNSQGSGFDEVITFFNVRFRLRNRDISIQNNLAGNILNPISGPFNGSLQKDSIVDIMLSSKKNFIEFKDPVLAGGIQFQTLRLKFLNPTTVNTTIRAYFKIYYDAE